MRLADCAVDVRPRPAGQSITALAVYLVLQVSARLGALRRWDRAGPRGSSCCRARRWCRPAPIASCRIRTMPSSRRDRGAAAGVGSAVDRRDFHASSMPPFWRSGSAPRTARARRCVMARMNRTADRRARRGQRSHLARLHPDVPRHVHGDPRHPGGRDLAADDPACARHFARCDELDPDRLSDRRDHRDPADRLADARADLALAVRHRGRAVHAGLDRLRLQRRFCDADRLSRRCRALPAAR